MLGTAGADIFEDSHGNLFATSNDAPLQRSDDQGLT